jgi:hypothetical protein
MVPRSDEEPVWAKATFADSSAAASTLKTTSALGRESLTGFMHSSKGDLIFWTIDRCGWETLTGGLAESIPCADECDLSDRSS